MRRWFKRFLVLVFVCILAYAGAYYLYSAKAATEDNVILEVFDQEAQLNEALTESETEDIFKHDSKSTVAGLGKLARLLIGPAELVPVATLNNYGIPQELRYGLLDYSVEGMAYAFLDGPSADIPSHYANMLLPDQMKPNSTALYAANGEPDTDIGAWTYLDNMGIGALWGISFGIAMSFVVLILVAAGFMVMFRSKVGGQAVVTVTMALQNIIIGSILALASYAIGAFFLNLSKYLVLVVAGLLQTAFNEVVPGMVPIYIQSPLSLFWDFIGVTLGGTVGGDFSNWWDSVVGNFTSTADGIQNGLSNWRNGGLVSSSVALLKGAFMTSGSFFGGLIIGIIAKLVIAGAMLVATLKVFWAVLQTYIKMLIDIIIAPIVIILSAVPGKQSGFKSWIQRMFKNSVSIALMFAFLNVAAFMALAVGTASSGCGVGAGKTALLSCVTSGLIPGEPTTTDWLLTIMGPGGIVALIMLNMVPSVPTMMDELLAGKGDFSKASGAVMKNLQSIPGIGGLFNS